MSFYNDCCRIAIANPLLTNTAGDRLTCPRCANEFVHDGLQYTNRLELGQNKIDKLRRVQRVNDIVRQVSEPPQDPT